MTMCMSGQVDLNAEEFTVAVLTFRVLLGSKGLVIDE